MKAIFEHRSFLDLQLLFTEFLNDWILVAALGFFGGLVIAFSLWYRSPVNLLLERSKMLGKESGESTLDRIDKLEVANLSLEKRQEELEAANRLLHEEKESVVSRLEQMSLKCASWKKDHDRVLGELVDLREIIGNKDATTKERVVPIPEQGSTDEIFKGEDANRDRVVFIMDISKSMDYGGKLEVCKEKLKKAIEELPVESRFQVIFFSDKARFANAESAESGGMIGANGSSPGWFEASPESVDLVEKHIDAVETQYGNKWDLPFMEAMTLDPPPKRISFLTDGEKADGELLASGIIDLVNRVGGGDMKVDTIALMAPGASGPLRRISKETKGKHLFVPRVEV